MTFKVLVADDSPTVRQQVSITLSKKAGIQVIEAEDGDDGLEQLKRHPDIGVILIDINMPNMAGLEMLQEIGKLGYKAPVIILTTESSSDVIRQAKSLGARAWIVKPFKPDQLVNAVLKLGS